MSAAARPGAPGAAVVGRAPAPDRALELLVTGLVDDDDALLGDLAEGRAEVTSARGHRAGQRWWRGQVWRALPRLVWHGVTQRPVLLFLALAGFVLWVVLGSLVPAPFGTDAVVHGAGRPGVPTVGDVVGDTVVKGLGSLLAAAGVGALVALAARRARLVPVLVTGALMALLSARRAFWVVIGPARCETTEYRVGVVEECVVELGAFSRDAVVPAVWQLPTMAVLVPLVTLAGALAVVAATRPVRGRRPEGGR